MLPRNTLEIEKVRRSKKNEQLNGDFMEQLIKDYNKILYEEFDHFVPIILGDFIQSLQ